MLPLDPDKLGLLVGMFLATAVLAFCFFYRRAGGLEVLVRAAMTFVIAYVATFLFVLALRHILATELAALEPEKRKGLSQEGEETAIEESEETETMPEEGGRAE